MSDPVVQAVDLQKRYIVRRERGQTLKDRLVRRRRAAARDEFWVLKGIDLSLAPGESIGIIGSNGAGKSTLLRLIAGILVPTKGTLDVRGRVGGLFELAVGFHPELSGRDNIALSGALMGYSPRTVRKRLDSIIEFSNIAEFIEAPVKVYSSGMALRLGFATAVAFEPEIVLVDEVLAVADEEFQRQAYQCLRELQGHGSALCVVSHELSTLQELCPRVIWLEEGRVAADGKAAEVVDRYLAKHGETRAD